MAYKKTAKNNGKRPSKDKPKSWEVYSHVRSLHAYKKMPILRWKHDWEREHHFLYNVRPVGFRRLKHHPPWCKPCSRPLKCPCKCNRGWRIYKGKRCHFPAFCRCIEETYAVPWSRGPKMIFGRKNHRRYCLSQKSKSRQSSEMLRKKFGPKTVYDNKDETDESNKETNVKTKSAKVGALKSRPKRRKSTLAHERLYSIPNAEKPQKITKKRKESDIKSVDKDKKVLEMKIEAKPQTKGKQVESTIKKKKSKSKSKDSSRRPSNQSENNQKRNSKQENPKPSEECTTQKENKKKKSLSLKEGGDANDIRSNKKKRKSKTESEKTSKASTAKSGSMSESSLSKSSGNKIASSSPSKESASTMETRRKRISHDVHRRSCDLSNTSIQLKQSQSSTTIEAIKKPGKSKKSIETKQKPTVAKPEEDIEVKDDTAEEVKDDTAEEVKDEEKESKDMDKDSCKKVEFDFADIEKSILFTTIQYDDYMVDSIDEPIAVLTSHDALPDALNEFTKNCLCEHKGCVNYITQFAKNVFNGVLDKRCFVTHKSNENINNINASYIEYWQRVKSAFMQEKLTNALFIASLRSKSCMNFVPHMSMYKQDICPTWPKISIEELKNAKIHTELTSSRRNIVYNANEILVLNRNRDNKGVATTQNVFRQSQIGKSQFPSSNILFTTGKIGQHLFGANSNKMKTYHKLKIGLEGEKWKTRMYSVRNVRLCLPDWTNQLSADGHCRQCAGKSCAEKYTQENMTSIRENASKYVTTQRETTPMPRFGRARCGLFPSHIRTANSNIWTDALGYRCEFPRAVCRSTHPRFSRSWLEHRRCVCKLLSPFETGLSERYAHAAPTPHAIHCTCQCTYIVLRDGVIKQDQRDAARSEHDQSNRKQQIPSATENQFLSVHWPVDSVSKSSTLEYIEKRNVGTNTLGGPFENDKNERKVSISADHNTQMPEQSFSEKCVTTFRSCHNDTTDTGKEMLARMVQARCVVLELGESFMNDQKLDYNRSPTLHNMLGDSPTPTPYPSNICTNQISNDMLYITKRPDAVETHDKSMQVTSHFEPYVEACTSTADVFVIHSRKPSLDLGGTMEIAISSITETNFQKSDIFSNPAKLDSLLAQIMETGHASPDVPGVPGPTPLKPLEQLRKGGDKSSSAGLSEPDEWKSHVDFSDTSCPVTPKFPEKSSGSSTKHVDISYLTHMPVLSADCLTHTTSLHLLSSLSKMDTLRSKHANETTMDVGPYAINDAQFDVTVNTYVDQGMPSRLKPGPNSLGTIVIELNMQVNDESDQLSEDNDDSVTLDEDFDGQARMQQLYAKILETPKS